MSAGAAAVAGADAAGAAGAALKSGAGAAVAGAGAALLKGLPQLEQNISFAGTSAPQDGQVAKAVAEAASGK